MKMTIDVNVKTWIEIQYLEEFEIFDAKYQDYYFDKRVVTKTFLNIEDANFWLSANKEKISNVIMKDCKEL